MFNPLEFEGVRKQAGTNAFTMSPQKENLVPPELTKNEIKSKNI